MSIGALKSYLIFYLCGKVLHKQLSLILKILHWFIYPWENVFFSTDLTWLVLHNYVFENYLWLIFEVSMESPHLHADMLVYLPHLCCFVLWLNCIICYTSYFLLPQWKRSKIWSMEKQSTEQQDIVWNIHICIYIHKNVMYVDYYILKLFPNYLIVMISLFIQ